MPQETDRRKTNLTKEAMTLTSADLGGDPLGQGRALGQLLSEALTHVVVDVVGPQQLLEALGWRFTCRCVHDFNRFFSENLNCDAKNDHSH